MQLRSTLRLSFLAGLASLAAPATGCDSGSPPPTSEVDAGTTAPETDA